MFDRLTGMLRFEGEALALRAHRQQVLASNIANVDTPGYLARDFDFGQALAQAGARLRNPADGQPPARLVDGSSAVALSRAGFAPGATSVGGTAAPVREPSGFLPLRDTGDPSRPVLSWRTPEQPALDRNTVDLDRERASFADNSLRYEATLRFINGHMRNLLTAIRGE